jgi:hypothetical protein
VGGFVWLVSFRYEWRMPLSLFLTFSESETLTFGGKNQGTGLTGLTRHSFFFFLPSLYPWPQKSPQSCRPKSAGSSSCQYVVKPVDLLSDYRP